MGVFPFFQLTSSEFHKKKGFRQEKAESQKWGGFFFLPLYGTLMQTRVLAELGVGQKGRRERERERERNPMLIWF